MLERHPSLRLAFTEQQALWVTEVVPMMDSLATGVMRARETQPLALRPSEYFHRQCVVANSLMARRDIDQRHVIGVDLLVWGSDAPHQEGSCPEVSQKLHTLFEGVPIEEARAILGGNCLRAYRVDPAAMNDVAARIGLSPTDLGVLAPGEP